MDLRFTSVTGWGAIHHSLHLKASKTEQEFKLENIRLSNLSEKKWKTGQRERCDRSFLPTICECSRIKVYGLAAGKMWIKTVIATDVNM